MASPERKPSPKPSEAPPEIASLLKPKVYQGLLKEREIATHAELKTAPGSTKIPGLKTYSFYSAMMVRSSLAQTRQAITDYRLYPQMVSYIDRAHYSPESQILMIEGGIWKYRLRSFVRFQELGERWIRYEIISGHFFGLKGDLFFEPAGEQGTLVYMRGETHGTDWPPTLVIERGAEIVFRFTAQKMRNFIESQKGAPADSSKNSNAHEAPKGKPDEQIPQPRSRL